MDDAIAMAIDGEGILYYLTLIRVTQVLENLLSREVWPMSGVLIVTTDEEKRKRKPQLKAPRPFGLWFTLSQL